MLKYLCLQVGPSILTLRGRELLVAGAPVVDAKALQRQPVHRFDHEMDQVVLRHPIPQVGRQKHRRVTVYGDKSCGHGLSLPNCRAGAKSDRLLGIRFFNPAAPSPRIGPG